jgi:RimJ/RimL family protein N-acetyltransferase
VVAEATTGEFVGVVGLMTIPWQAHFTPAVEIGWRIGARFRRLGYAEEAARAALGFGFATLGLQQIVAFTVPGNAASWKLMEKLGMRHEGEFDHPRLPEGHHYRRHLLYRLDKAGWRDGAGLG